jgi:hypothetical protein
MAASAGDRLGLPGAASNSDGGDAGEGDRGALHVAEALKALALKDSCAHCGKQGTALKRCSICKHAWYCGAACQNAAWKRHKKTCAPPLSTKDVRARVDAAAKAGDWCELLKWEGRMDELMEGQPDATCELILRRFTAAHLQGSLSTVSGTLPRGSPHHSLSSIRLTEQLIDFLGKMQRFRDQGEEICALASSLCAVGKRQEASSHYQKARKVGEAHGFFSVECRACLGLGREKISEGRHEEGLDLLRNALAASRLSENEGFNTLELPVLQSLIDALLLTEGIDEVERSFNTTSALYNLKP